MSAYARDFEQYVDSVIHRTAAQRSALRFCDPDGGELFRIEWDGTVVFGRQTDLDTISRQFWAHLRDANPLLAEVERLRAANMALKALIAEREGSVNA